MKVLHVIPSLSLVHGGPTRAVLLMDKALRGLGVSVEIATTDDDGLGRRNGRRCGQRLDEDGSVRWYFAKRLEFYKTAPGFATWILRNVRNYDLLHIHALFSFTTPVAAWAARRAGVPYIVRPLGTLNRYGMEQRRPRLKNLSLRWVEEPLLRHAAAVHFTSEEEAAQARALGLRLNPVIIPLGVELGSMAGDVKSHGTPCLLFLSRLDPKKNLEGLLGAMALLRRDIPAVRLLIAGDGAPDYVAQLKARAQALGLDAAVAWAGHLEGEAKARAFATADAFVLPSFSENFGIAAAEALAAGLPCVVGEGVAIATDISQAGAGIAVRTDAASIAAGVARIIGSQATMTAMSRAARQLAAQSFSVHAMGTRLQQLYTDILTR